MVYNDLQQVKAHPKFEGFLVRRNQALKRVMRKEAATPSSVINANQTILEFSSKTIYICEPSNLFEELLASAYSIAVECEEVGLNYRQLLKKIYDCKYFRSRVGSWEYRDWTNSFEFFLRHIEVESFIYFDDEKDQYYFKLFRPYQDKNGENRMSSILHALTRHWGEFTKYNQSPNKSCEYRYRDFLLNLINASINGNFCKNPITKNNNDRVVCKEIPLKEKYLRVFLYWDNMLQVYALTSAYVSSKSEIY